MPINICKLFGDGNGMGFRVQPKRTFPVELGTDATLSRRVSAVGEASEAAMAAVTLFMVAIVIVGCFVFIRYHSYRL
jgi:hypothetical protein